VTAIVDLIGGETLRGFAPLLTRPGRLVTAADAATANELGGARVARKNNATVLEAVAQLVVSGRLDPHVTATYPLDRAAEALAAVEAGHTAGKVVIRVR
jgi:NADPH2:quinone reductase